MDISKIDEEVMRVLDEFLVAFNQLDFKAWENTFHFPHYRLASGRMTVSDKAGLINEALMKQYLEDIEWHHSKWERKKIIHYSETKVHVDTKFTRYRQDESIIGSYESLYVLTKEEGKWRIKLRSSFAE